MNKITKIILMLFSFIVIALIAVGVFNFLTQTNEGELTIHVSPADSSVRVNNKTIKSSKIYLPPGSYNFEASRTGFAGSSQVVQIKPNKPSDVYLLLEPLTAEARNYLTNNPEEQQLREFVGGTKFYTEQDSLRSNYPLLSKLPWSLRYATISYGPSTKFPTDFTKIALIVESSTKLGREQGLAWIRNQGYDPTDYEIVFDGYLNPFLGGVED